MKERKFFEFGKVGFKTGRKMGGRYWKKKANVLRIRKWQKSKRGYYMPKFYDKFLDEYGLVYRGGFLNVRWLLEAYRNGVFPWPTEEEIVDWYNPEVRAVMRPEDVHVSHSMRSVLNQRRFELRIDTAFGKVIELCSEVQGAREGATWIFPRMIRAYKRLHGLGYAHSFEAWRGGKLVGGLYGVSLGRMFFGESMFYLEANASKFAFIRMSKLLANSGFLLIDCQVPSAHLASLGCNDIISREVYMQIIEINRSFDTLRGKWVEIDGKIELAKD